MRIRSYEMLCRSDLLKICQLFDHRMCQYYDSKPNSSVIMTTLISEQHIHN